MQKSQLQQIKDGQYNNQYNNIINKNHNLHPTNKPQNDILIQINEYT